MADTATDEQEKVEAWRLCCFLGAGCGVVQAERLAASPVDPHEFDRLVTRIRESDVQAPALELAERILR